MLPIPRPNGPSADVVRAAWSAVTIQSAWRLVSLGVAVKARTLDDAREHVLRSLPEGCSVDEAEWLTAPLVDEYVARRRGDGTHRVPLPSLVVPDAPREWRDRLLDATDRLGEACFRLRYADGLALDALARHLGIHESRVEDACAGLRGVARECIRDTHPRLRPTADELDAVLVRLATYAELGGPGPMGLLTPAGLAHADRCPRASRAVRLVRGGHLDLRSLFPPRDPLSSEHVDLMVVLVHPDAAYSRTRLGASLGPGVRPIGTSGWLVSEGGIEAAREGLVQACAAGTPPRHHVRGVRTRGPGRWSRGVLLGPLLVHALEAARARPWGEVAGLCELPPARPPPPRATLAWLGAAAMGAAVVLTAAWVGRPVETPPPAPIAASFSAFDGGWDVRFDTSDRASVDVIVEVDGALHVAHRNVRTAKGTWATGEGDFRLRIAADGVALVSSPHGIDELESLVHASAASGHPLESLAASLRSAAPDVDVVVRPPLAVASSL
jgi:hypothetical protein